MRYLIPSVVYALFVLPLLAEEEAPEQAPPWVDTKVIWIGEEKADAAEVERYFRKADQVEQHNRWLQFQVTRIVIDPSSRYVAATLYQHAMNRPGTDWDACVMVWDLKESKRWLLRDAIDVFDVSTRGVVLTGQGKRDRFEREGKLQLMLWDSEGEESYTLALPEVEGLEEEEQVALDYVRQPLAARFSDRDFVVAVQRDGSLVSYPLERRTDLPTQDPPTVFDQFPGEIQDMRLLVPGRDVVVLAGRGASERAIIYRDPNGPDQFGRRFTYGIDGPTKPDELESIGLFQLMKWMTLSGRGEMVMVPMYWVEGVRYDGPQQALIPMACANGECLAVGDGVDVRIKHRKADSAWHLKNNREHARYPPVYALSQDADWFLHDLKQGYVSILDAKTGDPVRALPCFFKP